MDLPDLIAHCDWGTPHMKRWIAAARRLDSQSFGIGELEPVVDAENLFDVLRLRSPNGPIFVGFDFPIGLPRKYAGRAGIAGFPDMLPRFGAGAWVEFYTPANTREEISLARPFYPRVPGGTKKQDLVDGLGLQDPEDLLRRCDRSSVISGVACGLFWTLGANQCGKAAISGWRDVLAPAMCRDEISLWPFDGDLEELLRPGKITVGEVYPAAIYPQLGIAHAFGKTAQEARRLKLRCSVVNRQKGLGLRHGRFLRRRLRPQLRMRYASCLKAPPPDGVSSVSICRVFGRAAEI